MLKRRVALVVAAVALLGLGCTENPPTAPRDTPNAGDVYAPLEPLAVAIAAGSGWELDEAATRALELDEPDKRHDCLVATEREVLTGDIAHYSFDVRVGPGPYDVIGLHRVVREAQPNRPIRTRKALFMTHGAGAGFRPAFLMNTLTPNMPVDQALPVYLAQNDIDVWGIDMAWTKIPIQETDFGFSINWGAQKEIDCLGTAINLARLARRATGNGWQKMHLLTWSQSVPLGFAYLDQESQLPPGLRQVRGYIPVEGVTKAGSEAIRQSACASAANLEALRNGGVYVDDLGRLAIFAATLARNDPGGPSPIFPGLTNYLAVQVAISQTFVLGNAIPYYHLCAGVFDGNGLPVDLQFVEPDFAVDFYANWSPYQPNLISLELDVLTCNEEDSPFDDHFSDITVPILAVGAGGGSGAAGDYMGTQVGSTDFQSLLVTTNSNPYLDFGHVDIFNAYLNQNARDLVWQSMLEWIEAHEHP